MAAEIVRQEAFEDVQLQVIEHEGEEWFYGDDIGTALGFADPRNSVRRIYRRNPDEFEGISCAVKLTAHDKNGRVVTRKVRIYNLQAVYKISFFADTPRAKAVRHWASHMLSRGMERLRERINELEAAARPQLPLPDGVLEEEIARLRQQDARRREEIIALMNALHLRKKKYLERILADPHLKSVFYDNLPDDAREKLALPAPEPKYTPGSDQEPIPVRRGVLKHLHACLLHPQPKHARIGLLIVRALLDGQEPPDIRDLLLLPHDLLKRDNYKKSKIWKALAEHDDAEGDQARQELKAIALYTQAALNFYDEIHEGFKMFDQEVWGIAKWQRPEDNSSRQ